jgi:hypothetical protein
MQARFFLLLINKELKLPCKKGFFYIYLFLYAHISIYIYSYIYIYTYRSIPPLVEMQARYFSLIINKELKLPSKMDMEAAAERDCKEWMYRYICMYIYVLCTYLCRCIREYVFMYLQLYVYVFTNMLLLQRSIVRSECIGMYMCMYRCRCIQVNIPELSYIYGYVYVFTNVCLCMYIQTYEINCREGL